MIVSVTQKKENALPELPYMLQNTDLSELQIFAIGQSQIS